MTCSAECGCGARDPDLGFQASVKVRLSQPTTATAESLPEIVGLLDRIFPSSRARAPDLDWQYLRNPAGAARYVNAYTEPGRLVAHYALLPTPPLAEPPATFIGTYFSLNTAVDPTAQVPGLMVATARALFRQLEKEGPTLVLGVANENSYQGFVRVLGFHHVGRLSLTLHAPGTLPAARAPRALATDSAHLAWRAARPGVRTYAEPEKGAVTVRLRHHGVPIDAVLSTGLGSNLVRDLTLPQAVKWTPRLYASFGPSVGGFSVPDRLRPSPLQYIVRVLGSDASAESIGRHLTTRRFEFLDFDVV
jgi:hypothetical protein